MKNAISPMAIPGLKTADEIAAEIWDIPEELLKVKTRKREVVEARMVLISYRYRNLNETQESASNQYGLKEHTSTIHACKTVDALLQTDKDFGHKHEEFCKRIK
ncbi:MAG TPA: hypothetical protein DCR40_18135 [Prolixibacteraceae bacterium]|nr:hypothetical protein [Prolixibacteraceae bacterium]